MNRWRVERVAVGPILPLRRDVLRAGLALEQARFEGDDHLNTLHLAVRDPREEVVACVSLMQAEIPTLSSPLAERRKPCWQLRGMAVRLDMQKHGLGSMLLAEAARRLPDEALWCNARLSAEGFYLRKGWVRVSEVFEIPSVGPHVRMIAP